MPVRKLRIDTNDTDWQEVVTPGSVINGVTILKIPTGVELEYRLGNNQEIDGIDSPITMYFGDDLDISDVTEGLWMRPTAAVVGTVKGWVSYRSSLPALDENGRLSRGFLSGVR